MEAMSTISDLDKISKDLISTDPIFQPCVNSSTSSLLIKMCS